MALLGGRLLIITGRMHQQQSENVYVYCIYASQDVVVPRVLPTAIENPAKMYKIDLRSPICMCCIHNIVLFCSNPTK